VNEPCCAENLRLRFTHSAAAGGGLSRQGGGGSPRATAWDALQARFAALEEEAEPEEPSPWDYILRRVRDILVDGDDERQTRALLEQTLRIHLC
jgi:hypothetical protein